ncbi:glycosyltransferase family 4 protein [Verrucomicrobiaceae bacterium R5-34]|nr:glycosyltransferase family 4 protein [Verrucomicrobiaceae bacterium R5-34]
MNKNHVCLCGPRPKSAVSGLSLAVELLITGLEERSIPHTVIDAAYGGDVNNAGSFSLKRAFETALVILKVWRHLPKCDVYYATLSTSTFGFLRDFSTGLVAKALRKRVVFHLHGGGFESFYEKQNILLKWLIRLLYANVDTVVVLGELLKEQFFCLGDNIRQKLVVVPNGLTLGVSDPGSIVRTTKKRVELLYMSSLMPSKGFKLVLDAVANLTRDEKDTVHLSLCGSFVTATTENDCPIYDEQSLEKYVEHNSLSNNVTYHGQVLDSEKHRRFMDADIFILPTSYPWEGQPLSIIEAMAYSLPVISCRHKGIPELVDDKVTGCFVRQNDSDAIADAVRSIVSNSEIYESMAVNARVKFKNYFTRGAHMNAILNVIHNEL